MFASRTVGVVGVVSPLLVGQQSRQMSGKAKAVLTRMKSVTNIKKITASMKMVAASKLRRVQQACEAARPFNAVALVPFEEMSQGVELTNGVRHMLIPITSDKGLCGGVNSAVAKQTRLMIAEDQENGVDSQVFIVGDKGRAALTRDQAERTVVTTGEYAKRPPNFTLAAVLGEVLLTYEFDVSTVIYNKFKSAIVYDTTPQRMIGWKAISEKDDVFEEYEFDTEKDVTLQNLYEMYVASSFYNGMLENATSEMSSRMTAMDNASRNAGDMLDKLTLTYNNLRQASITMELIEIISGAEQVNG
eukprot:GFYU01002650.1.p1 GENE.GFYU01002650.1~~GFYU01002650.1.p1  ORF type:complete len:315 (-),score=118.44 GFYU01002650.1:135-1043(-)